MNEKEISLFNKQTSNHEVFTIKLNEEGILCAFIGYEIPNGDFQFESIPYTDSAFKVKEEVEAQKFSPKFIKQIRYNALANTIFNSLVVNDGEHTHEIIEQLVLMNANIMNKLLKYTERYGTII